VDELREYLNRKPMPTDKYIRALDIVATCRRE
jgi:hypothetical protein